MPHRAARPRSSVAQAWTSKLAQADFALPGTLTVRGNACGKPSCRCHADPLRPHGP